MYGYGNTYINGGVSGLPFVPPLDVYTGAAAAYSLRLLRTAYTGAAIRVRRSSDSTESDIGFVSGVLDTATLLTFCGVGDGFVTTWYDQSGNAVNVTQATATNQPKIVSSGVLIVQDTKSAISFDGNDLLTKVVSFASLNSFFGAFSQTNTNARVFTTDNSSSGLRNTLSNDLSVRGSSDVVIAASFTTLGKSLISSFGTASCSTFRNGVAGGTGNIGSYISGTFTLGGSTIGGMAGKIQEFIFYNSSQISNRVAIETNINSYYGIY